MEVKVGDKIKIVRKGAHDWVDAVDDFCGEGGMDDFIGKTLTVTSCTDLGLIFAGDELVAVSVLEACWTFYSDSFEVVKEEMFVADGVVEVLETEVKEKKVKKEQLKMARNLYGVFTKDGVIVGLKHVREEARDEKRWRDAALPDGGKHTIMKLVPEKKVR